MVNLYKKLKAKPIEWYWSTIFWITVGVKTGTGSLELLAGFVFIIAPRPVARMLGRWLFQIGVLERFQDPVTRFVAELLGFIAPNLRLFYGSYLAIHGLVNLVMVISLILKKVWGYYFTFVFVGLLTVYQMVRVIHEPSLTLFILTLLDIGFLVLTYHQYQRFLQKHRNNI